MMRGAVSENFGKMSFPARERGLKHDTDRFKFGVGPLSVDWGWDHIPALGGQRKPAPGSRSKSEGKPGVGLRFVLVSIY